MLFALHVCVSAPIICVQPIDNNRHAVLMARVDAFPLVQVNKLGNPGQVGTCKCRHMLF